MHDPANAAGAEPPLPHDAASSGPSPATGQACLVDQNGRIVWVNEAWRRTAEQTGADPQSVGVGADYLRPSDRGDGAAAGSEADTFAPRLQALLHGAMQFFEHEYDCPLPDGIPRRFVVRAQAITLDGKRCAFLVHEDISRAHEAEAEVRASEQRLRTMFEAAADAVFLMVAEGPDAGRILDANTRAAAMHGYTHDELIGANIRQLDVPTDADLAAERIARLLREGGIRFEAVHRRKDGSTFPVEVTASPTRIGDRRCLVSFNRDVSERKRVEAELRENQIRLNLAAKASHVGFWDWDVASGKVVYSPEWKAQLGYAPHEVRDDYWEWRSRVHPDDLPPTLAAIEDHLAGRTSAYITEFRMRHRDGSYRWIYVRGAVLRDVAGEPFRFVGCHVDVTAQHEAEQRRVEFERRVNHLQRIEAMGTLAGGIAHDFNNILSIITGNVELVLLDRNLAGPTRQSLDDIRKASQRARSLVRQILSFSRDERPARKRIALGPVVTEAGELLRATIPQTIQLTTTLAPNLPDVLADAEQIHQVLVNLGTNAWHAIGERRGTVRFDLAATADGAGITIAVTDDGTGMDAATQQRIFEPFFTTKPSGQGTGLGLSVVHGIVKNHDGTIEVDSQPGRGTTFRIWLPACRSDATTVLVPRPDAAPTGRIRTLLLDDEPELLRVVERGLTRIGHQVTAIASPDAALAALDGATTFDVIVTDHDMPSMRGTEFVQRALARCPHLPILVCTGFMTPEAVQAATAAGAAQVLYKPVAASDLDTAIRGVLARATA